MSRIFGSLNAGDIVADNVLCRNLIVKQRATFDDEVDVSSAIIVGETIIDPTIGGIATLLPGQIFSGALVGDSTLNIQGVSTLQGPVIVQGDSTFQDLVSIDDNLVVAGGIKTGVAESLPSGWSSSMQLGTTPGAYLLQSGDPNPAYKPAIGFYSDEGNTQREVYVWAGEKSGNQETPQWADASVIVGLPTGTQLKEDVTLAGDLVVNGGVNIQGPLIVEGITDLCGGIQDTQLIYEQNLVGQINVLDIKSTTVLADNIQVTGRSNVVTEGVPQDVEFIVRISEEYKKPFTLRLLGQGQIFVNVDGNCTMTAEIYTDDTFSTPANKVLNPGTGVFSNELTFTAIGPEYKYAGLVCMPNPFDNIYVRGI